MTPIEPELLSRVTRQVLEEAAFVFLEPADSPPPFKDGEIVSGRIALHGPAGDGELLLATSAEVSQMLAANLLGLDPGEAGAEHQAADALGEIVNIIAGALLEQLYGAAPCALGLPAVARIASRAHEETLSGASCAVCFITDEGGRLDAACLAR
jgi:hypothetical protein